jgi:hypothetical protein
MYRARWRHRVSSFPVGYPRRPMSPSSLFRGVTSSNGICYTPCTDTCMIFTAVQVTLRPAVLGAPRTPPFGVARLTAPWPGRWHHSGRNPRVEPAFCSPAPTGFYARLGEVNAPGLALPRTTVSARRPFDLSSPARPRVLPRVPFGLIASGPVSAVPIRQLTASRFRLLPAQGCYASCRTVVMTAGPP